MSHIACRSLYLLTRQSREPCDRWGERCEPGIVIGPVTALIEHSAHPFSSFTRPVHSKTTTYTTVLVVVGKPKKGK